MKVRAGGLGSILGSACHERRGWRTVRAQGQHRAWQKDVQQPSTYLATGAAACKHGIRGTRKEGCHVPGLATLASQPELRCCLQLCTPRTLQLPVPRRHIPASLYCSALVLMAFSFCQLSLFYLEMNVWMFNRNLLNAERPHGCNIVILAECYPASERTQYTIPFCWSYQMNYVMMIWY